MLKLDSKTAAKLSAELYPVANKDLTSGFYYDNQLSNRLLSVTLHPNTILNGDSWELITDELEPEEDRAPVKEKDIPQYHYRDTPICRSVINEDFQVSIANNFTDFGDDMIGNLWNTFKPLAPYTKDLAHNLRSMANQLAEWLGKNSMGSVDLNLLGNQTHVDFGSLAQSAMNATTKTVENATDYLNRSLVAQGTRFSYYGGTGIDFSNLQMKFTIFSGYNENGKWWSVHDQIAVMLPYIIGKYIPVTEIGAEGSDINEFVQKFVSWQLPPGGFQADVHSVDYVQRGTLKLRIGSLYALENLVIGGAQFMYSKSLAKNPRVDSITSPEYLVPLSCEVMLALRPATKYSRESLERFVMGDAMAGTRARLQSKMSASYNAKKTINDNPDLIMPM